MKPLDATLARATRDIVRTLLPQGYTVATNAPETLRDCREYFAAHGRPCVSDRFDPSASIFGRDLDHYAFAAWHDYRHITGDFAFDRAGERLVNDAMIADMSAWWQQRRAYVAMSDFNRACACIRANNVGRLDYWHVNDEPPPNARLFTTGYLAALNILEAA